MKKNIIKKAITESRLWKEHGNSLYQGGQRLLRRALVGWPSAPSPTDRFTFVFSTGRTGTNHIARIFGDSRSFVCHEHEYRNTHIVMEQHLRPIATTRDSLRASEYVRIYKIPSMVQMLRWHRASRFLDTGHQIIFGIAPALLEQLPGRVSFIRLRRNRLEIARSYQGLPKILDPWLPESEREGHPKWVFSPTDKIVICAPGPDVWSKFNRFQRYLWYVDEVERQWARLVQSYKFPYLEVQTESLATGDYDRIAEFTGITYTQSMVHIAHNSSKEIAVSQGRAIREISEVAMRRFDEEYRKLTQ